MNIKFTFWCLKRGENVVSFDIVTRLDIVHKLIIVHKKVQKEKDTEKRYCF